ncbi:hypothetical protein BgAZ_101810 [Babesia gibsoni]|uniref:GCF C-terminal domain-containing protein n=1 Tax=Babesia gibsoni TaxID=33632 RepID=A0AAD8PFC8_BABGI|nr:hypothetical protein BgAZ_101810 [Babesia gibsoni]
MFAKRFFLGRSRTPATEAISEDKASEDAVESSSMPSRATQPSGTPVSDNDDSMAVDVEENFSFRRGIKDGRLKSEATSNRNTYHKDNESSQGGRPCLSFTDDMDDEGVAIRKGIVSKMIDMDSPETDADENGDDVVKSYTVKKLIKTKVGTDLRRAMTKDGNADIINGMNLDVDGDSFMDNDYGPVDFDVENNRIKRAVIGERGTLRNRQMFGVSLDADEEEMHYYDHPYEEEKMQEDSINEPYQYISVTPFLNSHMDKVRDEIEDLRRNITERRHKLNASQSTPKHYEEVMKSIEENLEMFSTLSKEAQALGGLMESKLAPVNKYINGLYNNRKDVSDSWYRMSRWLMCDFLRSMGIHANYSCGYLDETDDDGYDVATNIENTFESRIEKIQSIKSEQRKLALARAALQGQHEQDRSLHNGTKPSITECFTMDISVETMQNVYPHSLELEAIDVDMMDDVLSKYRSIKSALSAFANVKKEHADDFMQLKIAERLKPIYKLYALIDLLKWDPLEREGGCQQGSLVEREWFQCVKNFSPEYIPTLMLEVMIPAAINAIESWNITSYSQSMLLSSLLADVIKNLPNDSIVGEIEKVSTVFFKTVESRVSVLCVKDIGNVIKDQSIAGYAKFQAVQISRNIMCFEKIFTPNNLTNVIFSKMFIEYLMPLLDFQQLMDALAVAQFFAFTASLSPQLMVKNKTNAIVKSTVYAISERNWQNSVDEEGVLEKLNLKFTNADYLSIIDKSFGKGP